MQVVAEVLLRKGRQTFPELLRNINSGTRTCRQLHLSSSSNGGSQQSPNLTASQLKQVRPLRGWSCSCGYASCALRQALVLHFTHSRDCAPSLACWDILVITCWDILVSHASVLVCG